MCSPYEKIQLHNDFRLFCRAEKEKAGIGIGENMSHLPKLCPKEEEAEDTSDPLPPSLTVQVREEIKELSSHLATSRTASGLA